jgi:hypothetical protein
MWIMMLARLALLVAAYLSLDVSNPMMPGALTFGVEESVEVRLSDRVRGQDRHVAPIPRVPEPERLDPSDRSLIGRRLPEPVAPRSRSAHITRSRLSLAAPASPAEDH